MRERLASLLRTGATAAALGRMALRLRDLRPDGTFTVADALERQAAATPDAPALVFEDRRMSFRELDRAANRVTRWARAQGVGRGDVVALLMENRPEFVVTWLGLAKGGVTAALLNTNLRGRPLAHGIGLSEARHLVVGAELGDAARDAVAGLDAPPELWASGGAVEAASDLDADLARRSSAALGARAREGLRVRDDLFYIYTSGTTGLPKAARFSHLRFLATAAGAGVLARLTPADRVYVPLPLYHTAGGVMATGGALVAGAAAVLTRRFSARGFFPECVRHDVTVFQYIGELCRYLLHAPEHPDERRHRVRLCLGNGLRPEIWRPFQERFRIPEIVEFYGATEGNVVLANLEGEVGAVGRLPDPLRQLVGVHLLRFDVERGDVVRTPDGFCLECPPGEAGEAVGRISRLLGFEGYTDREATERKVLRDVFAPGDAYFRTGDLLRRDRRGYFYFVDRVGDTFRWKGENVSTSEVAEVLSVAPGVREANVYGVRVPGADGRAGMAALVVGEDFDVDALARHTDAELPSYARPLFLRLPRTMETTSTFKHRKVDWVEEGYDPSRVADPLYLRDPTSGRYVPLDEERFARIQARELRL